MKIEIEIPDPPKGWKHEQRIPNRDERFFIFATDKQWHERCPQSEHNWDFSSGGIFAFRVPPAKRLLRPDELAGKWLHGSEGLGSAMVIAVSRNRITTHIATETIENAKAYGWTYSETYTSERKPLEIEDEK